MFIARVVGRVILSKHEEKLKGLKVLVIQPLNEMKKPNDKLQMAIDNVGAGYGEYVLVCTGDESMLSYPEPIPPGDLGIIGILDDINI